MFSSERSRLKWIYSKSLHEWFINFSHGHNSLCIWHVPCTFKRLCSSSTIAMFAMHVAH